MPRNLETAMRNPTPRPAATRRAGPRRASPRWAAWALAAALTLAAQQAQAQQTDPADLVYWQSISASTDPAEYQSYVDAFPNGRFIQLARARLARLQAAGTGPASIAIPGVTAPATPGPAAPTANRTPAAPPPPAPEPADQVAEKIIVTPAAARVGQIISFACTDFPDPTSNDMIVVVPAGTPDIDPNRPADETKILAYNYASLCKQNGWKAGPFAPGRYEVRFVTRLYNNVQRSDVRTRTPFTVR